MKTGSKKDKNENMYIEGPEHFPYHIEYIRQFDYSGNMKKKDIDKYRFADEIKEVEDEGAHELNKNTDLNNRIIGDFKE